jgi:hypothetical protein
VHGDGVRWLKNVVGWVEKELGRVRKICMWY